MTNNIQKYTAYKPSGVEWLGEIPEHWEATKVKNIFRLVVEPAPKNNEFELLSVYTEIGVKPRRELVERGNKASTTDGYWFVKKGDIVVNKLLAWMGAIGVSDYDGVTSPAYDILRAKVQINSNYYHYLFRNEVCIAELKKHSRGIMDMRLRLYFDKFGDIVIPFPDYSTQQKIVEFLDRKTAQIDQAIGIKEKQIALLKERRQLMIHRAVTRGINPDIKLKPSGVEWIGDIPEHWEEKALKYIAKLQSGETISSEDFIEEGYPVYGGNGFRGYASSYTNEGSYVLIGRQGALCGNVNYACGKFYASEHAIVVYPISNENYIWLGEAIKIADFNRLSQSAAQPGIAVSVIKNVHFPYPDIEEQNRIAKYIETLSSKIATAISLKEQEIAKLKEYKSVLINGAVTGKVKVG